MKSLPVSSPEKKYRTATNNELLKVKDGKCHLEALKKYPRWIRPWFWWLTCLVEMGYNEVKGQQWAVSKSAENCGAPPSRSACYRALDFLKTAGIIQRSKLKIGSDCHGLIIKINVDCFKFFIKLTQSHTCAHVPKKTGDNPKNTKQVFSADPLSTVYINDQDQGQETPKPQPKAKPKPKKYTYNPIVYTLLKLTTGLPTQGRILFLAAKEIAETTRNNAAETQTGIDWPYWLKRWNEFTIPIRELTASREFLPILRNCLEKNHKKSPKQPVNEAPDDIRRQILESLNEADTLRKIS